MRHFEEYEIEHLFNSTGTLWFRFLCRMHLKRCELCRRRYVRVIEEKRSAEKFRTAILRFAADSSSLPGREHSGDKQ